MPALQALRRDRCFGVVARRFQLCDPASDCPRGITATIATKRKLNQMCGQSWSLLDALIKSGFDEEVDDFSTAEGDSNHEPDQFVPSDDELLRGSSVASSV
jgi:hypothetical protein